MQKLALGTAQFGQTYGVANTAGEITPAGIKTILQTACEHGIDTLDTAVAYGNSEQRLGAAGVQCWQVISKIPALPSGTTNITDWLVAHIENALQRLHIKQLTGLLLHHPADVITYNEYPAALHALKERGLVNRIGFSIYNPAELTELLRHYPADIIQAPLNVLDRRLIHSGWLSRLTEQGIIVHTRSVFLQGLLLMPAQKRPAYFKTWPILEKWDQWCAKTAQSPLTAALGFALKQMGVARVVVGVDSPAQFNQILTASVTNTVPVPDALYSEDVGLLEPARWQLSS